jgi:hypothetical protein
MHVNTPGTDASCGGAELAGHTLVESSYEPEAELEAHVHAHPHLVTLLASIPKLDAGGRIV